MFFLTVSILHEDKEKKRKRRKRERRRRRINIGLLSPKTQENGQLSEDVKNNKAGKLVKVNFVELFNCKEV